MGCGIAIYLLGCTLLSLSGYLLHRGHLQNTHSQPQASPSWSHKQLTINIFNVLWTRWMMGSVMNIIKVYSQHSDSCQHTSTLWLFGDEMLTTVYITFKATGAPTITASLLLLTAGDNVAKLWREILSKIYNNSMRSDHVKKFIFDAFLLLVFILYYIVALTFEFKPSFSHLYLPDEAFICTNLS